MKIMTTIDLRNTVKAYIDSADIKLLKMMKALAESYEDEEQEFQLSESQYELLDERRNAHLNEKSKSYSWEQVKQNAKKSGSK